MPRYLHRIHRLTPILQQSRRKGAKLRSWRVSILRQRAHYLGTVQAPRASVTARSTQARASSPRCASKYASPSWTMLVERLYPSLVQGWGAWFKVGEQFRGKPLKLTVAPRGAIKPQHAGPGTNSPIHPYQLNQL
jgi:hypothetical protein